MSVNVKKFEDLNLNKQILNAIEELGFTDPTPIQYKAIPLVLAGHDLFGIAPTGTGKTAAYVIPLLMKLGYSQGEGIRSLILAPTRELVIQIDHEISLMGKYFNLNHLAVFGGTGITTQIEALEAGVDILVATPGRFLDIYQKVHLYTRNIKTLVLDEADKMLDMGFMPQINSILEIIPPKKRQNLLFTATFPPQIEKLSNEFLEFPQKVEIKPQSSVTETIAQFFYKTPNLKSKINLLEYLLTDKEVFARVLIFTKTKETANNLFKYIDRKIDQNARVIHANKGQNSRINAINAFKSGELRILVSTDVTARGIDVENVSHVINFDVPIVYEDYVHRIGRTGRAFQTGTSITFVTPPDELHLHQIEKIINQKPAELPVPTGVEIPPTEAWEKQLLDLEMDKVRRKLDPEFKGAFHRKRKKNKNFRKRK